MPSIYYIPSRRLPGGAVWLALRCAVAAVPAAWLYAWLTIHLPLVPSVAALLAFALGLGLAMRYAVRRGRARDPLWMGRLGIVLGAIGWYVQAATWIALLETGNASPAGHLAGFVAVLAEPSHIGRVAADLFETGAYSIGGLPVRGLVLMAVWGAELVLLVGVPYAFGRMSAAEPFCEESGAWMQEIALPGKFDFVGHPSVLAARLASEPAQFFSIFLPHPQAEPAQYAVLVLYRGRGDPFVSVKNVTVRGDGRKKKESTLLVLDYLRLAGIDAQEVLRHVGAAVHPTHNASEKKPRARTSTGAF